MYQQITTFQTGHTENMEEKKKGFRCVCQTKIKYIENIRTFTKKQFLN